MVKSHCNGAKNSPLNKSHTRTANYWLFEKKLKFCHIWDVFFNLAIVLC